MPAVNDIAIDLGTSNVLVYMVGKGIVLRVPAVVAMDRETHRPKAVGADAYRMIGRTPSSITAVRPLRQGTMTDFEMTSQMLRTFVASVVGRHLFARPHAVMSVPTGINDVEKRRRRFYEHYTGYRKGIAENYDLCIRTDKIGIDGAVRLIIDAVGE